MVSGKHKSGSSRKVRVKTPGGRNVVHYRKRKPQAAHCGATGQKLLGVPRVLPSKLQKIPKSQRRPDRPFGGVLSSEAMRDVMKEKIKSLTIGEAMPGKVFAPGRLALKLAGRDAGKVCIVIEAKGDKVLIDGGVRRRSVNPAHIYPLKTGVKLSKGDAAEVKKIFESLGLTYTETKPKTTGERPKKQKKSSPQKNSTKKKSTAKKTTKKTAEKAE